MTTEAAVTSRRIEECADTLSRIGDAVATRLVGQERLVRRLIMSLLTGGHVLLEGVPGLAKSLACEALAQSLDLDYQRIQFTPDLLPGDIVGTPVFQPASGRFEVRKGPVFTHILLADEVNRAPAKVHSALLQAMQEKQVSIGDETFALDEPFLVLATQNPIEQEGTYQLPEAELDRFLFKVLIDYPSADEEEVIVERMARTELVGAPAPVAGADDVLAARRLVDEVFVDRRLIRYVLSVVRATREPDAVGLDELSRAVRFGASPRASIALVLAGRAAALLAGKDFVAPSDVKEVAFDVLRHRILLTYEAEADGLTTDAVIRRVLDRVEVP